LSAIFFAIILIAFVVAAFRQLTWTAPAVPSAADASQAVEPMQALATAMIDAAEDLRRLDAFHNKLERPIRDENQIAGPHIRR